MRLTIALILLTISAGIPAFGNDAAAADGGPRILFIGLDAVPYRTLERLADPARGDAELFAGLRGPVPVISTFPSTTSLAFAGILEPVGLGKSPGYEAKFFDRERGKIRGGGLFSYGKIKFPWREFWDWKLHGVVAKMLSGARPVKVTKRSIRRSLEAYTESDADFYFIYYTTSDLVSHLKGPDGLDPVLKDLDAGLKRLRADPSVRPFRTVIFSDHGMSGGGPLDNVYKSVRRALKDAGLHPVKKLRRPEDVVFVPFGLVSSFVAFTRDGRAPDAAAVMGRVEGVQLCAAVDADGGWRVESSEGSAQIRQDGDQWTYEPLEGDPLRLAGVMERLNGDGIQAGKAVTFPDRTWLDASRDNEYPDPLYRIARGFDLVENPASVICGVAPGYMYGATGTALASRLSVGRLRWTHGSMDREASLGFLMSDVEGWEPPALPLRFNEALLPFIDGRQITRYSQK